RELPNFTAESAEALGYSQVFSDEFDGAELDLSVWNIKHEGDMGGYFESASQDFLRDGDLILRGEWKEDGTYGEGWYTGDIGLIQGYARGYFESRIQCSKCNGRSVDFWSAFWIQGPSPYNAETSQGGIGPGGAEIDIMENFGPDHHTSCVYCGWGEGSGGLLMDFVAVPNLGNRYDEEYHIYGLLWDENYYQVYLDGVLVHCSDLKAGTSSVEEEVRFSLCARQGGLPDRIKGEPREMKVDYLRIWQRSTEE
ncbi:MAG: family 16 glycosylhydrolase, partial [Candidatus Methanomethylophilaceae archaeon]|nr:family 16 glycosylhydrolase [Candidatus Methanomethylophilaceae archaeon]